jgi:hypothetical protein
MKQIRAYLCNSWTENNYCPRITRMNTNTVFFSKRSGAFGDKSIVFGIRQ